MPDASLGKALLERLAEGIPPGRLPACVGAWVKLRAFRIRCAGGRPLIALLICHMSQSDKSRACPLCQRMLICLRPRFVSTTGCNGSVDMDALNFSRGWRLSRTCACGRSPAASLGHDGMGAHFISVVEAVSCQAAVDGARFALGVPLCEYPDSTACLPLSMLPCELVSRCCDGPDGHAGRPASRRILVKRDGSCALGVGCLI